MGKPLESVWWWLHLGRETVFRYLLRRWLDNLFPLLGIQGFERNILPCPRLWHINGIIFVQKEDVEFNFVVFAMLQKEVRLMQIMAFAMPGAANEIV